MVFHLAAAVGVDQSMYEIERYTSVNAVGTATLLEALVQHRPERLVVASSMSLYGEGMYRNAAGQVTAGKERSLSQLAEKDREVRGPGGEVLTPAPTPKDKPPAGGPRRGDRGLVLRRPGRRVRAQRERLLLRPRRRALPGHVARAYLRVYRELTGIREEEIPCAS